MLEPLIRQKKLVICGLIRAEVIRGILDRKQCRRMKEFFDLLSDFPIDYSVWDEVSDLAWDLDRKATVVPLSDLVIAVCAKRLGAVVVSSDKHFNSIPGLQVLKDLP
jgi:predicted nucleic acid-binding protein